MQDQSEGALTKENRMYNAHKGVRSELCEDKMPLPAIANASSLWSVVGIVDQRKGEIMTSLERCRLV